MYTGIVQGKYPVVSANMLPGLLQITLELPDALMVDLTIGASVAVDGVCLTVTAINGRRVAFDIMQQSLAVTSLGQLTVGTYVNVERSAKQGAEIGGHLISGHVDAMAELIAMKEPENNRFVSYQLPKELMKYLMPKGFVAVNGCSLTIAEIDKQHSQFTVCYIPETLKITTHGEKYVGDCVNIEIDRQTQAIVDTVERIMAEQQMGAGQ